jgi:hypothetical protein
MQEERGPRQGATLTRPGVVAGAVLWLMLLLSACGGAGGSSSSEEATGSADAAAPRVQPLEVVGGGSAQFRVEGGDNSIQDYGQEAGRQELRQAALAVHGYYAALAREEWAAACHRLAPATAAGAARFAPSSKGEGCAAALATLFGRVTAAEGREATAVDAASLRREGEQGFLLYRGAGGKAYFVSVRSSSGGWKVSALSPNGLP